MQKNCFIIVLAIILIIIYLLCKYPFITGFTVSRYFCRIPRDVRLIFTQEYNEQTSKFRVSLQEAADLALRFEEERLERNLSRADFAVKHKYIGIHYCIKGDYYVFSSYLLKGRVDLNGIYVHGITGEVKGVSLPDNYFFMPKKWLNNVNQEELREKKYPLRRENHTSDNADKVLGG